MCFMVLAWLMSAQSMAACPTQETAILYLNGVDTLRDSADASRRLLEQEVRAKVADHLKDCLFFDYVYNTNEPLFLDFMEAGMQKAEELGLSTSQFWRLYFRAVRLGTAAWFGPLLDNLYAKLARDSATFVLGDQVAEHMAKYRQHLALNRRVIIVPHSQGSLYANEEWRVLSSLEQGRVRIVAVATPADKVQDGGPYTTLHEDSLARFLFPFALQANAANTEPCEDRYLCHGFKESYMNGTDSRTRIVDGILALLPVPVVGGAIEGLVLSEGVPLVGWNVSLYAGTTQAPIATAVTDTRGFYRLSGVAAGAYWIRAYIQGDSYGFQRVTVIAGQTVIVNFPPPVLVGLL